MPKNDPRVDVYIARSADFARPILAHLRKLIHTACPDVEESIKWRMPSFLHKGILCNMAAFKQHCALLFWKGDLILGTAKQSGRADGRAMGQFGRITALSDLPADKVMIGYLKKAVELNDTGVQVDRRTGPNQKKPVTVPTDLRSALKRNRKAQSTFDSFSPSHKREYVEWIAAAKREETRTRRLAATIEWLKQGKPRNWKYVNC